MLTAPADLDEGALATVLERAWGIGAAAAGVVPVAQTLDLYRLGWDIEDIAYDTSRFRRSHAGTP